MLRSPAVAVLIATAAALFPALALALPNAGYPAAAALFLLTLGFWRNGQPLSATARRELAWLFWGCLALVLTVAVAIQVNQASWKAMQYPARFLFLPLLAWPLARLPFAPSPFWAGCAAGAAFAAALALDQYLGGNIRPGGHLNAIMFGNLALALAAFCLVALAWRGGMPAWQAVLALGVVGGLATNLLAGSRGGWLSLLLTGIVLATAILRKPAARPRPAVLAGLMAGLAVLVGAAWLLETQHRFLDIFRHTAQYLESGTIDQTSEAARLEMWKNALALWQGSPWLGIGPGNLDEAFAARARAGLMDSHASTYRHAHNQYLDALATGGIVGLGGLLAAMLLPLLVFIRRLRLTDEQGRPYALAGITLILLYMGYNVTQAMFAHNMGIVFYVIMLAVCWRGALGNGGEVSPPPAGPAPAGTSA